MTTQTTSTASLTRSAHLTQPQQRSLPSRDDLDRIACELDSRTPQEILAWALEIYAPRITLACSFGGPSGMVLLDMVMRLDASIPVFYLDTGLLFPETYVLAEAAARHYGITPIAMRPTVSVDEQAALYGEALWKRDPDHCCELRKVTPQREALAGYDAWVTGLRRDQSRTRRAVPVLAWDEKFGLGKLCPLANWTEREVWRYIADFAVPYNQLHQRGYPSIGCMPCTRPVGEGEDARAGRWSGFEKTECGLHTPLRLTAEQA